MIRGMVFGILVIFALLVDLSAVADQRGYEIERHPTTATTSNESGNNRHPMSGAKREMVTVTREGERVWQFVCIDECQRWSDAQLVQRALTLRAQDDRRRGAKR